MNSRLKRTSTCQDLQYERSISSLVVDDNYLDNVSINTGATFSNNLPDEDVQRLAKTYSFKTSCKDNLTISSVKETVIEQVNNNRVVIIKGPTGCGKTTQVPQYILENSFKNNVKCNIVVTQPRRIAAISIAKRVCDEHEWTQGSLVGYKVGLASCISEDTRLTYCTTGVLLQRLIKQRNMNDFTHIIIDEVHERDQDMDFLLLIVRKLLILNSDSVKIILMSSTINVNKFSIYFAKSFENNTIIGAPIVNVTKKNFYHVFDFYLEDLKNLGTDISTIWRKQPIILRNMYSFCCKLIKKLDNADDPTTKNRPTVLVFLPGIHEIEEMYTSLISMRDSTLDIVILHSLIANEDQSKIFSNVSEGCRRVILSTNISESSITVPNVEYVIDFCLTKQLVTDPQTNFQSLELIWASKANCEQRAGRTGRVAHGRVYRLVPKEFYQKVLPDENAPEILRAPLTNVFLKAKLLNLDKPEALLALALDPPDLTNLFYSVQLLKEAGALLTNTKDSDPCDGELTDLGRIMGELPIDIHITKLILLGHVCSVLSESIIMGASMAVKNMFSMQFQDKMSAHNAKIFWSQHSTSDGIAFYNAYRVWRLKKSSSQIKSNFQELKWARNKFLEVRVLREVDALVQELTDRLSQLGIIESVGCNRVTWAEHDKQFILKLITAGAFYPHYYLTEPKYNEKFDLDPIKTVYLSGWPQGQPGMLYAKRFQQLFSNFYGSKNNKIAVKFDHWGHVFVEFNKINSQNDQPTSQDKEFSGEIPLAIFQAIKMRKIEQNISIPVMSEDESFTRAKEFLKIDYSSLEKNIPTDDTIQKLLPPSDAIYIPIKIKHVGNPVYFWAFIDDAKTHEYFETIECWLESITINNYLKINRHCPIGSLVLAVFSFTREKKIYKRAIVKKIVHNNKKLTAVIFFIDFGITKSMPLNHVRYFPLSNPIAKIPALVFRCKLANVKPLSIVGKPHGWSKESNLKFLQLVSNQKQFDAYIYSVVDGIVSVVLSTSSSNGLSINQYMIDNYYADFQEEDEASRLDHEDRININKLILQGENPDTYVDPPSIEECLHVVKLSGPYSPLELKLHGLIKISMGLKVNVHKSSVNSILLDASIDEPGQKLLVAADSIQILPSRSLALWNTTLMPNIPGLVGLIGLIFAPRVELRCDEAGTRNTGVLCGLGYDPVTKKSLFPEHDMYIDFDVDVSINDLNNINRLRYWMSLGMFVDQELESDDPELSERILKIQDTVRDILINIFDCHREPVVREVDPEFDQWGLYDSSMYVVPKHHESLKKLVFQPHCALYLENLFKCGEDKK